MICNFHSFSEPGHDDGKLKKFFITWSKYSETRVMNKIERKMKIATWTSIVLVTVGVFFNQAFLTVRDRFVNGKNEG